jgi:penicillin-binding protein 1A
MRQALEESLNVPTVRLLEMVGVQAVVDVARRMGVGGDLRPDLTLALGSSEVSLLELTSAYGVIANRGLRAPPGTIRRVAGPGGETRWERGLVREPVLSEGVAFLLTSALQGVIQRGTGRAAQTFGHPAAGKTGTSQEATDLWFVGFTPSLIAGVWVGYDTPRSLGAHETGGRIAVPIWADFMRRALRGSELVPFQQPDSVYATLVNRRTGAPTGAGDPEAFTEFFLREASPPLREPLPEAPVAVPPGPRAPEPGGWYNDIAPPWTSIRR